MYKWVTAGIAIGFGIGLFIIITLVETWLAPFGNPITLSQYGTETIWDWASQTNFWKFMAIIWTISGIASVYLLYQGTEKTKPPQEPSKNTQKTYTEITEEPTHQGLSRTTVTMVSMEDLQKIANTITKPILHQKLPSKTTEKEPSHIFYVLDDSIRYQFTKTPPPKALPSTTTAISPINPPTAPPQKTHLIIKHRYKLALGSIALGIIFIAIYLAGFLPWLPSPIPSINLTLPALPALPTLPTTSSKELTITLVILGMTTAIGVTTIIYRRMKRK